MTCAALTRPAAPPYIVMCSVRQAAAVFALALVLRMNAFYRGEVRRLLRPLDLRTAAH